MYVSDFMFRKLQRFNATIQSVSPEFSLPQTLAPLVRRAKAIFSQQFLAVCLGVFYGIEGEAQHFQSYGDRQ